MVFELYEWEVVAERDHVRVRGLFEEFRLEGAPLVPFAEGLDFLDELTDVLEASVDGSVADVSDLIELVEGVHHLGADEVGGDLALKILFERLKNIVRGFLEHLEGYGALFAGLAHAAEKFVAVEGFAAAVTFEDAKVLAFDFFVGGETLAASDALASAADATAVLGQAGVDHLVLEVAAFGAVHLVEEGWLPTPDTTIGCGVNLQW